MYTSLSHFYLTGFYAQSLLLSLPIMSQGYEALEVMRSYPSSTSLWNKVSANRLTSTAIMATSLYSGANHADEGRPRHKKGKSKQQGLITSSARTDKRSWYSEGTSQDDEREWAEATKTTRNNNQCQADAGYQRQLSTDSGEGDDEGSQTHTVGRGGDAHEAETDGWTDDRSRKEGLRRERYSRARRGGRRSVSTSLPVAATTPSPLMSRR